MNTNFKQWSLLDGEPWFVTEVFPTNWKESHWQFFLWGDYQHFYYYFYVMTVIIIFMSWLLLLFYVMTVIITFMLWLLLLFLCTKESHTLFRWLSTLLLLFLCYDCIYYNTVYKRVTHTVQVIINTFTIIFVSWLYLLQYCVQKSDTHCFSYEVITPTVFSYFYISIVLTYTNTVGKLLPLIHFVSATSSYN